MNKIIIVGAGASGMVAAISAACGGAEVILIEKEEVVGRKILATGNGKCNYTNEWMKEECFRGDNGKLLPGVLQQFSEQDTIRFFKELGVLPLCKNGYVYPISGQAQTIQEVLLMEVESCKQVTLLTGTRVKEIYEKKNAWTVCVESNGEEKRIKGDCVILACGSKASSQLGSDGSGYTFAKQFGHTIVPIVPALVQLRADKNTLGTILKQWSGVRTQASVKLFINQKEIANDSGEVQFTDYGISGIPVFQISRYAGYGLRENKKVEVVLSFLPDYTKEQIFQLLKNRQKRCQTCSQLLTGMLNSKLIPVVLEVANIEKLKNEVDTGKKKKKGTILPVQGRKAETLSEKELETLALVLNAFVVPISGINDFDQAQICAGGVDTTEVTEQMESKFAKGLYFAGELLDVDGICGGYNLQWAWSTGWIAGSEAAKR